MADPTEPVKTPEATERIPSKFQCAIKQLEFEPEHTWV